MSEKHRKTKKAHKNKTVHIALSVCAHHIADTVRADTQRRAGHRIRADGLFVVCAHRKVLLLTHTHKHTRLRAVVTHARVFQRLQ